MKTLQDLKDEIERIEEELAKLELEAKDIVIQHDYLHPIESFELYIQDYLGFLYVDITIK